MTRISYKDYITEDNGQLRVPMTPTACKATGCHTYFWSNNGAGMREAVAKAKAYAVYVRRHQGEYGFEARNA